MTIATTPVTSWVEVGLAAVGVALGLFVGMLVFLELGRRLRIRRNTSQGDKALTGVGVVDGAVYGLLGLLIGFMFSGAAARFDQRRDLVAQQAIATGVLWQRIDLLPAEAQVATRMALRRYVDAIIETYTNPHSPSDALRASPAVLAARRDLWTTTVAACVAPGGDAARPLLIPALNQMFDLADRERIARRIHPPLAIVGMLGLTTLAAALFAGYGLAGSSRRHWMHLFGFAATTSLAVWVIIELEYPRGGLIRVDAMDQMLIDLRSSMQ